ncbi:hypothetical protein AB5J62_33680 [Amycolatopsis sp. cg5]|uniref:hypothetical protein n=1 Tax=Amycolatopsis sp. cg5 TaxID=3238802 RepID=UPI003526B623
MQPGNSTTVAVTTVAGAVALVLVWVLDLAHIEMPPAVASAVTVVLSALAGYLAPARTSRSAGQYPAGDADRPNR